MIGVRDNSKLSTCADQTLQILSSRIAIRPAGSSTISIFNDESGSIICKELWGRTAVEFVAWNQACGSPLEIDLERHLYDGRDGVQIDGKPKVSSRNPLQMPGGAESRSRARMRFSFRTIRRVRPLHSS